VELLESMPSFLQSTATNTTSLGAFIQTELLSLCISAVVISVVRSYLAEDVRKLVRLDSARNNSNALSSILYKLCDSVTCLDADLKLTSPSKQLASLLHKNVAASCQVGDDFLHYVVEEDRETARSTLLAGDAAGPDDARSETTYVHLRDSFGIKVRCQMLYASFQDLQGARSVVVGINEIGERTPIDSANSLNLHPSQEMGAVIESAAHQAVATPASPHKAQQVGVEDTPASDAEASDASSGSGSDNSGQATMSRCVCFRPDDFKILGQTKGFSQLSKKKKKTSTSDLTRFWGDPDDFAGWVNEVLNDIVNNNAQTPCYRTYGPQIGANQGRDKHGVVRSPKAFTMEVCFPPLLVDPSDYNVVARLLSIRRAPLDNHLSVLPEQQRSQNLSIFAGSGCAEPGGGVAQPVGEDALQGEKEKETNSLASENLALTAGGATNADPGPNNLRCSL